MFQPFNNEQPCPERPATLTAPGVKVYYSDYVIPDEFPQEVKAVYSVDCSSFEPKSDNIWWAGCVVNSISEVQQSSPEGFPRKGARFDTIDGHYFLVTEDAADHRLLNKCLNGEESAYCTYRIVRNFVLGSEKIGHEIVLLTFNSSGEVINAKVDVSASDYSRYNNSSVASTVDFTESQTEIEEISERLENLRAQIAGEESRYNKLREFFALANELGYSVVKKHQG